MEKLVLADGTSQTFSVLVEIRCVGERNQRPSIQRSADACGEQHGRIVVQHQDDMRRIDGSGVTEKADHAADKRASGPGEHRQFGVRRFAQSSERVQLLVQSRALVVAKGGENQNMHARSIFTTTRRPGSPRVELLNFLLREDAETPLRPSSSDAWRKLCISFANFGDSARADAPAIRKARNPPILARQLSKNRAGRLISQTDFTGKRDSFIRVAGTAGFAYCYSP